MEVETCDTLREPSGGSGDKKGAKPSYASGGQYGFADKVVDGITVSVNSVILTLKSKVFTASFQVSAIASLVRVVILIAANFPVIRQKEPRIQYLNVG